jgi:hypothetical protein
LCRRDHGLTWAEFINLTLAQLEALEERRAVELRHARFNAALIACAIINSRNLADTEPLSPWTFIPGYREDPAQVEKEKLRRSLQKSVAVAFARKSEGKNAEEVRVERAKMIERVTANGVEDAEGIFNEVFPNL